jgi:cardiolipin synthase
VLTVPNALTLARLACLPYFMSVLSRGAPRDRTRAALLLSALGVSDGLDGYIARRFDQASELGRMADPLVDRVLVVTAVAGAMKARAVPRWFVALAGARELSAAAGAVVLAARGRRSVEVSRTGKAGAFAMMVALPLFLQSTAAAHRPARWLRRVAWALALGGQVMAWAALAGYIRERDEVVGPAGGAPSPAGAGLDGPGAAAS